MELSDLEFEWPLYVARIIDNLLLGSGVWDAHDLTVSSRRSLLVGNTWEPCEVTRHAANERQVVVSTLRSVVFTPSHEFVIHAEDVAESKEGKTTETGLDTTH